MEDKKNRIVSLCFYLIFIVFILAIIFYWFVSFRIKYTAFIEFSAISAIIILPTILPRTRIWIKIALNIFLFLLLSRYAIANQPDLELGALIYVPFLFFCLLIVVIINHFLFKWVQRSENVKAKSIIISIMLIAIVIFVIFSTYNIYYQYIPYKNGIVFDKILCAGAYTKTSSGELKGLCEKIIVDKSGHMTYWQKIKSHCLDVANKIKTDKYYFDFDYYKKNNYDPLRWPGNYRICGEQRVGFLEWGFRTTVNSNLVPPEVEDPALCEYADGEYSIYNLGRYNLGRARDSVPYFTLKEKCYATVAFEKKDPSFCYKINFSDSCFENLAESVKNTKLCDEISDFNSKNLCYGRTTFNDSYCAKINGSLQINCYSYIAKYKNDISICNKATSDLFINECKDWYKTKTFSF